MNPIPLARSTVRVALAAAATLVAAPAQDAAVTVLQRPPADAASPHYPGNRPPLWPTPLIALPVGAIEPRGWLLRQLRLQMDGCHGHLGEISAFLRKEGSAWLDKAGKGGSGWEEPVYWLKGFGLCAYLLRDEVRTAEARIWIEGILRSQQADGWFGPDAGRSGAATRLRGRDDLWPNMIALFCLQDYFELTGDERVLALMNRYFRYLMDVPDDRFLVGYWPKMRGGDLLFSVYWLHARVGDDNEWLLELARKVHRHTADWTSGVIDWHNVNMAQGFGEPTTYWLQSGAAGDLRASYRNYDTIRQTYGQVPGGMFGGDENCRPGYTDPRQAIETCGIVEMMLSLETLTWITGDPLWADRCEDVAFNSLPAALTPDLKALRYLTAPNHVLSDRRSKSPGLQNGGPMLLMSPHLHRCCQHDWGHGWPYYGKHLWFATRDRGLAAALFSECRVTGKVGAGAEVSIDEDTHYPFDGTVRLVVHTDEPATFPLYLRIPGWCSAARLAVDGEAQSIDAKPLHWVRIDRAWRDGDKVELTLPMTLSLRRWPDNHDSVSVDRGPLTYSLEIGERYVRAGGTDAWPEWEILPTTPWNYGLVLDGESPAASFRVVTSKWPADDMPFTHEGVPIRLRARGRRIPAWQTDDLGLVGVLQQSPVQSAEPTEEIALCPMGAARLRISAFPVIGQEPGAHEWQAPPAPPYAADASHCFEGDTVRALADGLVPASSGDETIPRLTFWDHKGTTEWMTAEFEAPCEVSHVAIYWFDDTGRGGCRVPAAWRLFVRQDGEWRPVAPDDGTELGVAKDRFNEVSFAKVTTDALRAEMTLQSGFSAGVLEWRIE